MGLKLTYSKAGLTYTDSYHRVTFGPRDKKCKELLLLIKIYASKAYADTNPNDFYDRELIYVNGSDFDTYFGLTTTEAEVGNLNPEARAYAFLQTIDPAEEGSQYPHCRFDYKNDSTTI